MEELTVTLCSEVMHDPSLLYRKNVERVHCFISQIHIALRHCVVTDVVTDLQDCSLNQDENSSFRSDGLTI